ncbi:hypothetical protein BJX70DRAFT_107536 [Aspergillus crustosus]
MDRARADEETRVEVELLILDYLVCMAIYNTPNGTVWVEDIARIIELVHPTPGMPQDLQIKTQMLQIIQLSLQIKQAEQPAPGTLAALTSTFVSTCEDIGVMPMVHAIEVASRICVQAALQEYRGHGHTEGFAESLTNMCKRPDGRAPEGHCQYITPMPSVLGISEEVWLGAIMRIARENEDVQAALLDAIAIIMEQLEPPVLLQLERGKLTNLSRTETQALIQKIGMH